MDNSRRDDSIQALSRFLGDDASYALHCETRDQAEVAVNRIASKLDFSRLPDAGGKCWRYCDSEFELSVSTFETNLYEHRTCWALQGVLSHKARDLSIKVPNPITSLGAKRYRKNPVHFLTDIKYALDVFRNIRSDYPASGPFAEEQVASEPTPAPLKPSGSFDGMPEEIASELKASLGQIQVMKQERLERRRALKEKR